MVPRISFRSRKHVEKCVLGCKHQRWYSRERALESLACLRATPSSQLRTYANPVPDRGVPEREQHVRRLSRQHADPELPARVGQLRAELVLRSDARLNFGTEIQQILRENSPRGIEKDQLPEGSFE